MLWHCSEFERAWRTTHRPCSFLHHEFWWSAVLLLKYLWVFFMREEVILPHFSREVLEWWTGEVFLWEKRPESREEFSAFVLILSCFNQGCALTVSLRPKAASGHASDHRHQQPSCRLSPNIPVQWVQRQAASLTATVGVDKNIFTNKKFFRTPLVCRFNHVYGPHRENGARCGSPFIATQMAASIEEYSKFKRNSSWNSVGMQS